MRTLITCLYYNLPHSNPSKLHKQISLSLKFCFFILRTCEKILFSYVLLFFFCYSIKNKKKWKKKVWGCQLARGVYLPTRWAGRRLWIQRRRRRNAGVFLHRTQVFFLLFFVFSVFVFTPENNNLLKPRLNLLFLQKKRKKKADERWFAGSSRKKKIKNKKLNLRKKKWKTSFSERKFFF